MRDLPRLLQRLSSSPRTRQSWTSLCNHKDFATRWADGESPTCTCSISQPYHPSSSTTPSSSHTHRDGDSLTLNSSPLTWVATGSLQNKIFPSKKEILKSLKKAFTEWHRKNAIPSLPTRHLDDLWTTSCMGSTHQSTL